MELAILERTHASVRSYHFMDRGHHSEFGYRLWSRLPSKSYQLFSVAHWHSTYCERLSRYEIPRGSVSLASGWGGGYRLARHAEHMLRRHYTLSLKRLSAGPGFNPQLRWINCLRITGMRACFEI